jgi:hypothetical protein
MALKYNGNGGNIGKLSSLPHHPLCRVHLSLRAAAHDATATTTIAYTTTTTITNLSPTRAISVSLASTTGLAEGRRETSAATVGASLDNAGAGIIIAATVAAATPTAAVAAVVAPTAVVAAALAPTAIVAAVVAPTAVVAAVVASTGVVAAVVAPHRRSGRCRGHRFPRARRCLC